MTFLQLVQELTTVPGARFKTTQASSVKAWLNARCAELWNAEDWTFRKATASLPIVAGTADVTEPTDIGIPLALWTDLGDPVEYVSAKDYYDAHAGSTDTGTPELYTVVNRQIRLHPTPSVTASYTLYYDRCYGHLDLNGAFVAGDMTADTDVPAIPTEAHYLLIHGARSMGAVSMNDFTYQFDEQAWQNGKEALKRNYLTDTRGEPIQWGMQ